MPLRRLARQAREAWEVPRDLFLGRYPDFVTGGALPKGHVPVFVFHSVEPQSFERKLRYLADNSYVTLSAEEYFQVLMRARPAPDRAVVLTFDDGRGSLWSVGFPLMKRFGMKGIVFLVPGRTRLGPPAPTWDDVRDSRGAAEALLARESKEAPFLSWQEIEAMAHSGLMDFESHTLTHARVHTSPQLAGFASPALRLGFAGMDVPLIHDGQRDLLAPEVPLGTPLFRSAARTGESLRFFEEPTLRRACVERVAEEGEGFFYRKDWERQLRRLLARIPLRGTSESPAERDLAIRRELSEAKVLIEAHTGRPVHHLCYPWHTSGPTAQRIARDVGYRTAFCGKVPGVPITLPGGDPHAIARVGEDYLERLPGRGRADLTAILRLKWSRRLGARAGGAGSHN